MLKKSDNEKYVQAYRGLRGPAWRLALAAELPPNRMHRLVCEADADVRGVHHFQQLCSQGDRGLARAKARYPGVAATYTFNHDEAKCTATKILTLGGCERSEIATRLGVEEHILTIASILLRSNHLGVNPGDSIASLPDIEEEAFPLFQC